MRGLGRALALGLMLVAAAPAQFSWEGVERIVAVGDVHGDYSQFMTVLRDAGLVDADGSWSGGKTHLVQTGDVADRGPDTRRILDLLRRLQKEAGRAGGFVHALIGNHEAMNVYGDLRYVTAEEFASFADLEKPRERARALKHDWDDARRAAERSGQQLDRAAFEAVWNQQHPPGYFGHRQAFSPEGEYGGWIIEQPAVIRINDILFLHGGLSPPYAERSLEEINETIQAELRDPALARQGAAADPNGPLWYRGWAQNPPDEERPRVQAALAAQNARRAVVGHTVMPGAVLPRFEGQVIFIDVGLASVYGGRRACLLIEGDKLYALHRGRRLELPMADAALPEYLKAAARLDPSPSPLTPLLGRLNAGQPLFPPP